MATESPADDREVPWPSVAGPAVPEKNSAVSKTPRLDMNTSLALLRRELALMQQQDRGIHKQLLTLNSAIRDLKKTFDDSWDIETNLPGSQSHADVEMETLHSDTQVSHAKQDSGILMDEDSGEEDDVFEEENSRSLSRVRSASVTCLHRDFSSELDINQNVQNTSSSFRGYNLSMLPRTRSHTVSEGQFRRVTSMPVINEDPSTTPSSKLLYKAFAIYGYVKRPESVRKESIHQTPSHMDFHPLTRYESMPVIPSNFDNFERTNTRQVRSGSVPFHQGIYKSFVPTVRSSDLTHTPKRSNKKKPLYRIWRSSSQISLV